MKPVRVFEPSHEIESAEDFIREIKHFCKDEHTDFEIIEKSMSPVVEIDGRQFKCVLKEPNLAETENPYQRAFGMIGTDTRKVVALYKSSDMEE